MGNGELRNGKAWCRAASGTPAGWIVPIIESAGADRSHQAGELRDTGMSRLRRATDMCSSTESGTAQR